MSLVQLLGGLVCATGLFFLLVAALGLVRLPDALARQHAATKAGTVGTTLFALGVMLLVGDLAWTGRLALLVALLLTTLPLSSHAFAASAASSMLAAQPARSPSPDDGWPALRDGVHSPPPGSPTTSPRMSPQSLDRLNQLSNEEARATLQRCCGASRWVEAMVARRPFGSVEDLHQAADEVWATMTRDDILEAFDHHPRIGASLEALREKFGATAKWSAGEQASVASADESVIERLRDGNVRYEQRFGHIFIVCASGKSAAEMLALLEAREHNAPDDELRIAAGEQAKITHLRLDKLEL